MIPAFSQSMWRKHDKTAQFMEEGLGIDNSLCTSQQIKNRGVEQKVGRHDMFSKTCSPMIHFLQQGLCHYLEAKCSKSEIAANVSDSTKIFCP